MPPFWGVNALNEIYSRAIVSVFSCFDTSEVIFLLLLTQNTQVVSPTVEWEILQAAAFPKHLIFFHDVLCILQGVNGCLSRIPVCFIKVISPLSHFNDKQRASSHILLPTPVMNRDYPGNIGGRVYARCRATTSDCMGLVLITSCKPAASVVGPNQTLSAQKQHWDHRLRQEIQSSVKLSVVSVIHFFSSFTGVYSMTHSGLGLQNRNI